MLAFATLALGYSAPFSRLASARALRTSSVCMEATGPVCIVTGGSRGLGRAIALALGGEGCKVVVNYASSAAAAEKVCEEVKGLGGDAVAIQADMSTVDGINSLFKATGSASSPVSTALSRS